MVYTKSSLAASLGVTTKTLRRWVTRISNRYPELFDFELFDRCRVLPPSVSVVLCRELGLSE